MEEQLPLPQSLKPLIIEKRWQDLDRAVEPLIRPGGVVFKLLHKIIAQKRIEYIISVRDGESPYEEDGIWHDDGSRPLAFSLGLTLDPESVEGGILELREKGDSHVYQWSALPFGKICVFKTGVDGYEHRVLKVTQGTRVVMAGWCYLD